MIIRGNREEGRGKREEKLKCLPRINADSADTSKTKEIRLFPLPSSSFDKNAPREYKVIGKCQ
jgi:hypothetical protein